MNTVSHEVWKKASLIRLFEEALLDLYAKGLLFGTVHTCIGQEFSGIAIAEMIRNGDTIFSNHRCHGHFLAKTGNVDGLMAEIMGKETGVCAGIGGSQHLYADGFMSNGIQGGMMPISVGVALANKLAGKHDRIVAIFIGDGTLGEGIIYEALNLMSIWRLPILVIVENNHIAQSTLTAKTLGGTISARAEAFNIKHFYANTRHVPDLLQIAREAVDEVRHHGYPSIFEIETWRLRAHSKGDDTRPKTEVDEYKAKDPLTQVIQSNTIDDILKENQKIIDSAIEKAKNSAFISPEKLPRQTTWAQPKKLVWQAITIKKSSLRYVRAINHAIKALYDNNPKVILLGEDIQSPYGGAFKVTENVGESDQGARVYNMPISEAAIIGVSAGLALSGYRPIVEIMFGDFLSLAFDQMLNHACKFQYIYNNQVTIPMIVRTPMGGYRGYGPTHSQSIEKYLLGIPYLTIVALNQYIDPRQLYPWLINNSTQPTLVIENKNLYTTFLNTEPPFGYKVQQSNESPPSIRLCPINQSSVDITIFCYGGMLNLVEQALQLAFEEAEILCEVICPTMLHPLNIDPLTQSVDKTRKLLTVEEGPTFSALGSEVVSQLNATVAKKIIVKRLGCDTYLPTVKHVELEILPSVSQIIKALLELHTQER